MHSDLENERLVNSKRKRNPVQTVRVKSLTQQNELSSLISNGNGSILLQDYFTRAAPCI
jgi:hypothetical protein